MSITYIIGSSKFFDNDAILLVAKKIIESAENGTVYKLCTSVSELKKMSYEHHVIRVKNSELSYAEEDFLENYHLEKRLYLLNDTIVHDWWLTSFFNNIYLHNPNTGKHILLRRNRSKL